MNYLARRAEIIAQTLIAKPFQAFRWTAALYYTIFSHAFWREMQGVLAGRVRYLASVRSERSNRFLLVRNTHRLEKGLLMRPPRPVFALEYIRETVEALDATWQTAEDQGEQQLNWALDVAIRYFERIDVAKAGLADVQEVVSRIAKDRDSLRDAPRPTRIPYQRQVNREDLPTAQQFNSLAKHRKSVRWYTSQPVPRAVIDQALETAALAPTACNRQPYRFHLLDDPALVQRVASIPMGTAGWRENIPMLAVLVGHLDAYFSERDRHVVYIDASLAAQNFMLALETHGLSSCPINFPDIERRERRMAKALGLAPYERPIMCLSIGYPDPEGLVAYSEKRVTKDVRVYHEPS